MSGARGTIPPLNTTLCNVAAATVSKIPVFAAKGLSKFTCSGVSQDRQLSTATVCATGSSAVEGAWIARKLDNRGTEAGEATRAKQQVTNDIGISTCWTRLTASVTCGSNETAVFPRIACD